MRALIPALLLAVAGMSAAQGRPIAGQVVDRDGRPAAAARVTARWFAHPELPLGVGLALDLARERDVPVDDRGRFRFEPPIAGAFLLAARSGDDAAVPAFPVTPGDFVRLALEPTFCVEGVVRSGGAPVAGAGVELADADGQAWYRRAAFRFPDAALHAETDPDGRFALRLEPGYLTHPIWYPLRGLVAIAADGRRSGVRGVIRPLDASRHVELDLGPACAALRVLDAAERPVAAARVVVSRYPDWSATTDREGQVELPPGASHAWILAAGRAATEAGTDDRMGAVTTVHVASAGRLMIGAVRAAGAPLRNARVLVSVASFDGPPLELVTATGPTGSLDVRGLPDGVQAHVFVEVDGAFRPLLALLGPSAALAACDAPAPTVVEGQVLDADGVPAEHARVGLTVAGWPPWIAWADRGGRFRFEVALPPDGDVELAAQSDGRARARAQVDRAQRGPIVLRGARGRDFEGTCVDADGRPVARAFVTWVRSGEWSLPGPSDHIEAQVVFTDADGRFRFRDLPGDPAEPSFMGFAIVGGVRLQGSSAARLPLAGEAAMPTELRLLAVKE